MDVEVALSSGLPAFSIVGLPDPSIQEARERVRSAIQATGHEWPLRRVTVNLSPAHLRKTGSSFDLAMALALLSAAGRVAQERLAGLCVIGELGLDGSVRRVRGALPATLAASRAGARAVVVPLANAREAVLAPGVEVLAVDHLSQAVRFLRGEEGVEPARRRPDDEEPLALVEDLSDVRGQPIAKRALEIVAAGGHNLLMVGPPGGGKTMLARRLPGIMPPMTDEEAFEVTRIYSVAGLLPEDRPLIRRRPFRAPHHSGSTTGIIGGGTGVPHPGEASLAHRGVLFLDELGEFRREALQALRQPLEDGSVTIVRSRWAVTYPARFQLVAASNPCACGYAGDDIRPCTCLPGRVDAYADRLSGPVLDRIDLQIRVARVGRDDVFGAPDGETSCAVAARVAEARARQRERLARRRLTCNAEVPPRDIERTCRLHPGAVRVVEDAIDAAGLTARGAHRVVRVARTIADLRCDDEVDQTAVEEALSYRVLVGGP